MEIGKTDRVRAAVEVHVRIPISARSSRTTVLQLNHCSAPYLERRMLLSSPDRSNCGRRGFPKLRRSSFDCSEKTSMSDVRQVLSTHIRMSKATSIGAYLIRKENGVYAHNIFGPLTRLGTTAQRPLPRSPQFVFFSTRYFQTITLSRLRPHGTSSSLSRVLKVFPDLAFIGAHLMTALR